MAIQLQQNDQKRKQCEQDAPFIEQDNVSLRTTVKYGNEKAASPSKKEGLVVVKKINKTIEIKEKEHDEMRN